MPNESPIRLVTAALLMYAQSGEKLKSRDEQIKLRLAIKVMDAKNAAAVLESKSPAVQALVESRKPPPPKAPVAAAAPPPPPEGAGGESPPPAKKRKTSEAAKPPPPPPVDPNSYVGKRLAKHFEIDSEDGGAALVPFFGVITEYVEGEKWWHVVYDDDDNEDLFEEELLECFALYEKTKSGDLRGNLV